MVACGGCESDANLHSVERHLELDLAFAIKDFASNVGQHEASNVETSTIGGKLRIVHMEVELGAIEIGALTQKQVGARAERDKVVGPSAVAGKDQRLAVERDLERERNVGLHVRCANCADARLAEFDVASRLEDDELELAGDLLDCPAWPRKHCSEQPPGALLEPLGPRDREVGAARLLPYVIEQEERQAGEMITMQMTDEDQVDVGRCEIQPLHRANYRRPRLHQDAASVTFDHVTGLETPAASEGVTRAEDRHVEGCRRWRLAHITLLISPRQVRK